MADKCVVIRVPAGVTPIQAFLQIVTSQRFYLGAAAREQAAVVTFSVSEAAAHRLAWSRFKTVKQVESSRRPLLLECYDFASRPSSIKRQEATDNALRAEGAEMMSQRFKSAMSAQAAMSRYFYMICC
jgi:hypothetical protein